MYVEYKDLKVLLQQTICDSLDNKMYKKLGEHTNCSKCDIALTRYNYEKDRTFCKKCSNDNHICRTKKRYDNESSDIRNSNINNKKATDPKFISIKTIKKIFLLNFLKKLYEYKKLKKPCFY